MSECVHPRDRQRMDAGGTGPEFQKRELNMDPRFCCYVKSRGLVTFSRPCRRSLSEDVRGRELGKGGRG